MANKSLTDLVARTATALTDLLHINSGGTDYKQTKQDFLQGDFYYSFSNDTLITTQADNLATGRYFGTIASYGHQSETGVPVNSSFYVHLINYGGNYKIIYLTRQATGDVYFKVKVSGTWQNDWTQEPTRDEINLLVGHMKFGSFSNTISFEIPMNNASFAAGLLIFRLVQGIGPLILKFQIQSGVLSVANLAGDAYSNANLSISLSGSNLVLKNGSITANSTVLAIYT